MINNIQIHMNRVQELIIKALTTADNNSLRQQAENTIFGLLQENAGEFFLTCSRIVADNNKRETIRQSAASVMKAVLAKRTDNQRYFWDMVAPNIQLEVKEIIMVNLVSENLSVIRAAANVIAQIAAIQIPRGQWLSIVNMLANNTIHKLQHVRMASIITLGFICEELKNIQCNVDRITCQQIMGSIILCSQQHIQLLELSLTALRNSINFLRDILQNENYCTKFIQFIFPYFNSQHRDLVYEILFQFGRFCYHLLGNYIGHIAQVTIQHIDERNESSIRALEFWDTVGTEYLRRLEEANSRVSDREVRNIRNFIEELQDVILPSVMGSILITSKKDIGFPELREAAVKTLSTFVASCGRQLVDKVTEGVSKVLMSVNPGERQASALLFSCLVEYADKDYIQHCFANGFSHLYQLIEDPDAIVRRNTLNGFTTLAEYFPDVFLNNPNIFNIFQHLLRLSTASDETIQVLTLTILINITEQLKDNPNCEIIKDPDTILQTLMSIFTNNLNSNTNKQSNEKIIGIIMNIIMATNKRIVIIMLIKHLAELYYQYSKGKIRDQEIILGQILAIVHTSVLAMVKFPTDMELKKKIYELLDTHLNIYGVQSQGINLIGAISLCFKREFLQDQFQRYWSVVIQGLEMVEQKPTFRGALTCIQDIARNNQHRIAGKLTPVYQKLIGYMLHSNIDRELKTEILRCFGDLTLGMKGYAQAFVHTLLKICEDCFAAVEKLSQIQSEKDYAEELKQTLIEMYHCVVFALNDQNGLVNRQLAEHFPIISTFIVRTCNVKYSPTVDYVKNGLYLIFDAALFYSRSKDFKETVNRVVSSKEVFELIEIIRKYKDKAGVSDILAFIEDKLKNQRK